MFEQRRMLDVNVREQQTTFMVWNDPVLSWLSARAAVLLRGVKKEQQSKRVQAGCDIMSGLICS